MRHASVIGVFAALCLMPQAADAKGILVKFLPNPAEDSIVRYDVYRTEDTLNPGPAIGSILPSVGDTLPTDTLRYPDLAVEKGHAYFYSIRGVNAAGLESDASAETTVGLPLLAVADTLRPDPATHRTGCPLAAAARPLKGVPLAVTALDSSRIAVGFDSLAGRLEFRSARGLPAGGIDTGRVVLRAAYFGKFADLDTVLVIVAATAPASAAPAARFAGLPPGAAWAPDGALRLTGLPASARVEILSPLGAAVFRAPLAGPEADLAADRFRGLGYHPGYLIVRDGGGRMVGAFPVPAAR